MATGILHFRVDDRMLHGLVAIDWAPYFNATRAMVVDDPASQSDIMRASFKMACPAGVALSVLDVEKASANMKAGKYAAQRVFCVFRDVETAYRLFKTGVEMPQLNLGNVTQNAGDTIMLDKTVRVSPTERDMLREMRDAGVKVTARFRSNDEELNVADLLN